MDKILVYDEVGQEFEKEVILMLESDDKTYILYSDINQKEKKLYASYFFTDTLNNNYVHLINNLSDDEYSMLEKAYLEGRLIYD